MRLFKDLMTVSQCFDKERGRWWTNVVEEAVEIYPRLLRVWLISKTHTASSLKLTFSVTVPRVVEEENGRYEVPIRREPRCCAL